MPTPPPSDFEQLQSVVMRTHNRLVNKSFRGDVADDDSSTPESAMKYACTIRDNDTAAVMAVKQMLFFFGRDGASNLRPPIWTVPDYTPDVYNELRPQVILRFAEKHSDREASNRQRQKVMRVSYRLMNETTETLTQANIDAIARAIELEFPTTYFHKTGHSKHTYIDKPKGLNFIVSYSDPGDGKALVMKFMDLLNFTYDKENASESHKEDVQFSAPRTIRVLGEVKNLPQRRPVARVYLDKVELNIYGNQKNILLLDRGITGRRR